MMRDNLFEVVTSSRTFYVQVSRLENGTAAGVLCVCVAAILYLVVSFESFSLTDAFIC